MSHFHTADRAKAALPRPFQCVEVHESSGLRIEALRRFSGDSFYGIGLITANLPPIYAKSAQFGVRDNRVLDWVNSARFSIS